MKIDFFRDCEIEQLIPVSVEQLPYTFLKGYRNFAAENYNFEIVIAIAKEHLIFIAISLHKTKLITNAQLLSEPFTPTGVLSRDKQEAFLNTLMDAVKGQKLADRIITPQNFVVFSDVPVSSSFCNFGSYVVNLRPSTEALYANVHPKHRNKISKADRAGVAIKEGKEQLERFYEMYSQTMKRSGMYCEPYDFFNSFYTNLGDNNCYCAVVYHNGYPQGAILAPFTKYCCYYIYGASAENITESGAINFLHWNTMKVMKERGVERYDFVGARLSDVANTKLEGIQSFKERFGGELKKGYLFKMDLNPFKCRVHDKLLLITNKMRGRKQFKDIIDQEIEKARS